jgi:hypothetical protein
MTKKELYEGIKAKANPTEFETLGITLKSDKDTLQSLYDAYNTLKREPNIETVLDIEPEEPERNKSVDISKDEPEEPDYGVLGAESETPEEKTDDFDELLGKVAEAGSQPKAESKLKEPVTRTRRKNKKGASSPDSFHVSGYILLLAIDTVMPNAMAFINNMIDKKHDKINPGDLRLSEKDMQEIEPLADQAADYLTFNLNPVAGFFIAAAFLYTNNIIAVKAGFINKV